VEHARTLVVRFASPVDAREAIVSLEAKGIDAALVNLRQPDAVAAPSATRDADASVIRETVPRAISGAVIACVVGAAVGAAVGGVATSSFAGAVLGALVGVLALGALGAFWGASTKLPVNEDAYETSLADPHQPVIVEVKLIDAHVEQAARETLAASPSAQVINDS
jgi:uncharacterized membrane protein